MNFPLQLLERMSETRISIRSLRSQAGNPWTQEARVRAREEHGNPETERGQLIAVGLGYPFDETVKTKAPEIVCHPALGDLAGVDAKHLSQGFAEILVGETVDLEGKHDKNAEQRLDTWVIEAERRDPLLIHLEGLNDLIERTLADCTVVADSLDVEQTSVGLEANLPQCGQVGQSLADLEIASVVDGRLSPQGAAFLIVLLDPSVFIVDMQRWDDSLSDHSGLAASRGLRENFLAKDQLNLIRAAEIQVLADDLFKEDAATHRLVKNLRQRKLRLQDREIVTIPCLTIPRCEGVRKDSEPLAGQAVDLLGGKIVTDLLQPSGIVAPQNSIVESFEAYTLGCKLSLCVLVPIEAELSGVGKIGGELQEERPKITINAVEVVLVDEGRGAHDPRVRGSCHRIPALFRPKDRNLLLGFANEQNTFLSREASSVLSGDIILALALPERDERDLVLLGKALDGPDEALADGVHQSRRGESVPEMRTEECRHSAFGLKIRYVDVEVEAVNPLDLQGDPVSKDLGDALRYTHSRLRLTRSLGTTSRLAAQKTGRDYLGQRSTGAICSTKYRDAEYVYTSSV
jgi:hypothetical protein